MNPLRVALASPRVLRWGPVGGLFALVIVTWSVFLSGGLRSVVAWIGLLTLVPLVGGLVVLVVGVVAVLRRRLDLVLLPTFLVSAFAIWPFAWNFQRLAIPYPYRLATAHPSATVRLPLDGPVRVAWGGDDLAHNQHAAFPDQRWAYDLTVEPAFTGSHKLEDYGCYGKEVVAPIAGEVWRAHDGEPEQVPGQMVPNFRAPLGNNVVLRLATGTFLVIAHLKTGSVAVRRGAHVEEGEVVGRCGDSGNTSEPHVHIHHQRQDPRLFPVNFAEGLPLFFRDSDGPRMPLGGLHVDGVKVTLTGDVVRYVAPPPHLASVEPRSP